MVGRLSTWAGRTLPTSAVPVDRMVDLIVEQQRRKRGTP